jgi:3'(2'), 5'-bisphosphate nucleotidase
MISEFENYLGNVIELAKRAGCEILSIYKKDIKFELKADDSPLTKADFIANDIISTGLSNLTPEIPILSEEGPDMPYQQRKQWEHYWLIDPLDGSSEFLKGTGDFTINIALINNNQPVLGVSYLPAHYTCYFACCGGEAIKEDADGKKIVLHTKTISSDKIRVAMSRNIEVEKLQPFLSKLGNYQLIYFGSSLKLCLVAEGLIDIYPRLGFIYEWDTAAGQCIVEQAGGMVVDLNFEPLRYNTKDSLYNPYFLVLGDISYNWQECLQFLK